MKPKPWWETYPREYWTPADYAAAPKAGVKFPSDDLYQPINPTIPTQLAHPAPSFTLNPSKATQANDALRKAGIKRK
jgi:hypothetical protein